MTTYAHAKTVKEQAEKAHADAAAVLKTVSGDERGPMGMVPDHIKQTPEWQDAFKVERTAFYEMREVNRYMANHFKKEMRDERNARRA